MALLTVGTTFDQAKNKINKIQLLILGIQNSEIQLFDDVSMINERGFFCCCTIILQSLYFQMLLEMINTRKLYTWIFVTDKSRSNELPHIKILHNKMEQFVVGRSFGQFFFFFVLHSFLLILSLFSFVLSSFHW